MLYMTLPDRSCAEKNTSCACGVPVPTRPYQNREERLVQCQMILHFGSPSLRSMMCGSCVHLSMCCERNFYLE